MVAPSCSGGAPGDAARREAPDASDARSARGDGALTIVLARCVAPDLSWREPKECMC